MANGLAAVCCNENPKPIVNKPEMNNGKDSALAAGINSNVPMADIIKPILIPFLYPILKVLLYPQYRGWVIKI